MLVPKLRFKRKDGTDYPEWRGTSFGETCSGFEYGMNTAACDYDGVNKYIRITDIDDTSRRYLSENAVSPKGNMQDKYIVNPNDILFARTGASVGKAYLYKDTDGLLYYAGFLIRANVNADANAYFVFSQTLTADYWNWVKLTSMRTGQQGINAQEYKGYKYNAPCLEEQQKIADFLSTVDEVIAQSEAEVHNLEQQKKVAMQKIFSQEVRFKREDGTDYPEWEETQLIDIATRIIVGLATTVTPYYRETGVPMFRNLNIKSGLLDDSDMLYLDEAYASKQKTKIIHSGDIITVHTGNIGWSCVVPEKYEGALSFTTLITTIKKETVNNYFVSYYLNSDMGMKQMQDLAFSGGRANLNTNEFQKVVVPFPKDIEEQQKIADFLSAYDEAISYAKQELDKWKELKKGLLQQMFV